MEVLAYLTVIMILLALTAVFAAIAFAIIGVCARVVRWSVDIIVGLFRQNT